MNWRARASLIQSPTGESQWCDCIPPPEVNCWSNCRYCQKIKVDGIDSKGIPWCLDRGSGDQYSDWSTCYPNLAVDPNDIMRHPSSSPNFADYYINPVRPILPPPWDPYGYGASRNRLVSATQPAPWGQPTQTNNSAATDTNTQQGQNPADRHKTCECSLDDHEKLFCAKKDVKCNTIPLPARASEYDGEIFYDTCHPPTSCSEQREEWNAQPGLGARTCECIDKANGQKRAWCKKSRFQCTWIPTSARGNVIYCQMCRQWPTCSSSKHEYQLQHPETID